MKIQDQVRAFHKLINQPTSPAEPMLRQEELRARLIAEEAAETVYALVGVDKALSILLEHAYPQPHHKAYQNPDHGGKGPNLVDAIDGIADTIVVCVGTAEAIGINIEPFLDEVMRSNMAKRDPSGIQAASDKPVGKAIKPAGWTPPDIQGVLDRQIVEHRARARMHTAPPLGSIAGPEDFPGEDYPSGPGHVQPLAYGEEE